MFRWLPRMRGWTEIALLGLLETIPREAVAAFCVSNRIVEYLHLLPTRNMGDHYEVSDGANVLCCDVPVAFVNTSEGCTEVDVPTFAAPSAVESFAYVVEGGDFPFG